MITRSTAATDKVTITTNLLRKRSVRGSICRSQNTNKTLPPAGGAGGTPTGNKDRQPSFVRAAGQHFPLSSQPTSEKSSGASARHNNKIDPGDICFFSSKGSCEACETIALRL